MSARSESLESLGFQHRHLLGIEGLSADEIGFLLDLADSYVDVNRQHGSKLDALSGRTVINLFFEGSTRTRTSFELAAKRLGADVINMSIAWSSIKKGETLIDTAMTLNAMHPDVLVVRHPDSGAVKLLSEKVNCAVINGGDGSHEHPTQALLDAYTIRERRGNLEGARIAICGDINHSRVARSNVDAFTKLGAEVVLLGIRIPPNYGPRYRQQFEGVFRDVAERYDVPWIEFFMEGVALNDDLMQDDGIHPNEEAQPVLLDNAWPIIAEALAR